ncbi:MAG: DHH family phosphoesterase [archaeon]
MKKQLGEATELVKKAKSIQVITHLDADGLSSGGIISQVLERAGKEFSIITMPGIHKENVKNLPKADLTIFTDLGSGQLDILHNEFKNDNVIILDHHKPFGQTWDKLVQINPHLIGKDGSNEISGAGVAYHFGIEMSSENVDLSKLAVVGAIGDIQNFWGKLEGMNAEILDDAVESGAVSVDNDILFFGRHTRPIFKTLQYFTDPFVPGVSNNEAGAIALLEMLGIPFKENGTWRSPVDLNDDERRAIADELIHRAIVNVPAELMSYIPGIVIGEQYTLNNEKPKSEFRGALEFSTCLNATGRNDRPEIGLEIAKGNKAEYEAELMRILTKHRRNIAQSLRVVEESGTRVGPKEHVQYFDAGEEISSKIIGTIASMTLGSEGTDPYKPMVGMARTEFGTKVSARCSRLLVLSGIDLATSMRAAAGKVGGTGGGHMVACGGNIPEGTEEKFIAEFEEELLRGKK